MADEQQAREAAETAATGGASGLLRDIAERLGAHAGAQAVFGDPVERDGVTVVPVAQVMIGAGAGSGSSDEDGSGSGAGGGAMTRPLGYLEVRDGGATFVPLRPSWTNPAMMAASVLITLILSRTLLRIVGR